MVCLKACFIFHTVFQYLECNMVTFQCPLPQHVCWMQLLTDCIIMEAAQPTACHLFCMNAVRTCAGSMEGYVWAVQGLWWALCSELCRGSFPAHMCCSFYLQPEVPSVPARHIATPNLPTGHPTIRSHAVAHPDFPKGRLCH